MMCQHLFLKIISNIFVVGTGQKFWYDQGMRGIFLYEDPTMLGRCQSRALNNLSNFKGGFNQLPWCRWGTLPLTPPLKPLWVNVNEIAPPNFQCRARQSSYPPPPSASTTFAISKTSFTNCTLIHVTLSWALSTPLACFCSGLDWDLFHLVSNCEPIVNH